MNKVEITNTSNIANDISSLIDHIASLSTEDKEWFSRIYFIEVIKSQHYTIQSQDELATHVNYVGSQELLDNARYIVDWLADLQERDPKQHAKLSRITFQQALGHSKKWHAELAKQAEQSDRYIEPDAVNAPKVLDMGEGWEAFWLKTKQARKREGDAMGHCVGSGFYDGLNEGEAVLSIRRNNVTHITLHMDNLKTKQAVTKGNGYVPDRYQHLVDEVSRTFGLKLFIGHPLEDLSPILDGWHENSKGDKAHVENGLVKSDGDNNAVIYANGRQEWRENGKLERNDDPAVIDENGNIFWYKNGKPHRLDGPAVIHTNGRQEWWVNGDRHREDGPAVIYPDVGQSWCVNGRLHRLDGPAVIRTNGAQEWFRNGKRHREDGPAVILANGCETWFKNGKRHREDGPAAILEDGTQEWWMDGKKHRNDGPAVIGKDGSQF